MLLLLLRKRTIGRYDQHFLNRGCCVTAIIAHSQNGGRRFERCQCYRLRRRWNWYRGISWCRHLEAFYSVRFIYFSVSVFTCLMLWIEFKLQNEIKLISKTKNYCNTLCVGQSHTVHRAIIPGRYIVFGHKAFRTAQIYWKFCTIKEGVKVALAMFLHLSFIYSFVKHGRVLAHQTNNKIVCTRCCTRSSKLVLFFVRFCASGYCPHH